MQLNKGKAIRNKHISFRSVEQNKKCLIKKKTNPET